MTIDIAPVFLGLREVFLTTKRGDLAGLDAGTPIYAAMFETVGNGTIVSTAVSAMGDASFYTSQGGGGLGGIKVPAIRELAKACLAVAHELIGETEAVDAIPPPPAADEVTLILLTDDGLRLLRMNTAAKVMPGGPMSRMTHAFGAVVKALVAARPKPPA